MPLLTVFSTPKPFTDPHIATIQRNAICSWMLLPDTEVILVGDESGLSDAAREIGVRHLPDVARNDEGTPLISSIFALARGNSTSPLLAYVNADILLFADFVDAARQVAGQKKRFLIVGRRWDLDVTHKLDFSDGWQATLQANLAGRGKLHRPGGSDYFIFPRECYTEIPDFAVGRSGWDNWMIYKARRERWAAVDATAEVLIIHQKHDYSHLPGGQRHHRLPESKENMRLGGGRHIKDFRLYETSHRLEGGRVSRQPFSAERVRNELYIGPYLYLSSNSVRTAVVRVLKSLHLSRRHAVARTDRRARER